MKIRTYSELKQLGTFKERWEYLALKGTVGETTFGFERWINQDFYRSREWKYARRQAIIRDNGCDLGMPDHEIYEDLYVHHMNPMSVEDITSGSEKIIDPEYLITVAHLTHNAIHYGDERLLPQPFVERKPGDTKFW
jgi:hypothetical protein